MASGPCSIESWLKRELAQNQSQSGLALLRIEDGCRASVLAYLAVSSGLFGRLYHFPSVLRSVLTGAERSVKKKSAQCLGQETPLELDGHLVQITTAGGHRIVEAVADSIFRTSTRQLPT